MTPVEPNGLVVNVAALDNYYQPETVEITAGTEVLWEARGRNEHDVLPADAGQEWGAENEVFHPGDTYSHVFDTARNVRLLLLDPRHGDGRHDRYGRRVATRQLTRFTLQPRPRRPYSASERQAFGTGSSRHPCRGRDDHSRGLWRQ